ncbi:hypothetical protein BBK36DRAFT_1199919 [Trichoderma citrinoviride]|uniref:Alpha/beta-hydrolase n=1 Tax=Trichoderma citrinoviride TaxID=58853 RepID=A0A2T4BCY9_9HYPO|nr:hypothetical protein BBK36DRAFT_1199919 [Trichoderma citrinoviride]PTB67202.1 hypothetical protein BBK36DRAFT_1199919 [Trichoderma citrinoviride]
MFSSSLRRRCFSVLRSAHPPVRKSVPVTCGSGGSVEVDLYNVDEFSPTKVLFLHLPSLPDSAHGVRQLPEFLHDWPVASINYRWATEPPRAASQDGEHVDDDYSVDWPVPIHDVAFAYQWVVEALKPPSSGRGNIYVYGSHLGAGLAMSLSLTNAHPHKRFAVRGVAAYNGVYNWTMFLPGHKVRGAKSARAAWRALQRNNGNLRLDALGDRLVALFQEPHNLFDPFASPSLFFHNPGLAIPESFYASAAYASLVNAMKGQHDTSDETLEASRRSHLVFPPRASTLKIPETLLLHDAPSRSKVVDTRHTFMAQAAEMASFMRRSIEMVELKERAKWDEDAQRLAREPERRVQVVEVGQEGEELGLNDAGQQAVLDWLGSLNIR